MALTNVVVIAAPLKSAVDPLMKFVPVRVMLVAPAPAVVELGLMLVSVGAGFVAAGLTVKVCAAEVPPPGAAVNTVMLSLAAAVRSEAGMVAVNWVALTNVVVIAAPLKSAVDPLMKFVPVRVMLVAPAPAVVELGLTLVSVGAGLEVGLHADPMKSASKTALPPLT